MSRIYRHPPLYPLKTQSVAYTATAGTITNPVGNLINVVRIIVSTSAHIRIGENPTATTGDFRMVSGVEEYFTIKPGQKVSAVQNAAGGTLYVTEMTQ